MKIMVEVELVQGYPSCTCDDCAFETLMKCPNKLCGQDQYFEILGYQEVVEDDEKDN